MERDPLVEGAVDEEVVDPRRSQRPRRGCRPGRSRATARGEAGRHRWHRSGRRGWRCRPRSTRRRALGAHGRRSPWPRASPRRPRSRLVHALPSSPPRPDAGPHHIHGATGWFVVPERARRAGCGGRVDAHGPLAQLVAHLHDAQGVRGSSPLRPTSSDQVRHPLDDRCELVKCTRGEPSGEPFKTRCRSRQRSCRSIGCSRVSNTERSGESWEHRRA